MTLQGLNASFQARCEWNGLLCGANDLIFSVRLRKGGMLRVAVGDYPAVLPTAVFFLGSSQGC